MIGSDFRVRKFRPFADADSFAREGLDIDARHGEKCRALYGHAGALDLRLVAGGAGNGKIFHLHEPPGRVGIVTILAALRRLLFHLAEVLPQVARVIEKNRRRVPGKDNFGKLRMPMLETRNCSAWRDRSDIACRQMLKLKISAVMFLVTGGAGECVRSAPAAG